MKVYSSATVWEFKLEVAKHLELTPKYLQFELGDKVLQDDQNGSTIAEIGIKSEDIITARRVTVNEYIETASIINYETGMLCDRAIEIFTEWFHLYCNADKKLDDLGVAKFITKATNQYVPKSD